jgi:hypothetical protein
MKKLVVGTHAWVWLPFVLAYILSAASLSLTAQSSSRRVPIVSDWTRHHVLYRESSGAPGDQTRSSDPRRIHSWYAHHPEFLWPQLHRRFRSRREPLPTDGNRDWAVPLGAANFAPTYDGMFSFSLCCGAASSPDTGIGNLTAIDLGNDTMLATQGNITLTTTADGAYTGSYVLYPGGPNPTWTSDGSQFDYDNLVYPGASSQLDCNGLLFGNRGIYEANLRRYTNFPPGCPNNANYEYKDYNSAGSPEDNWGTSFALNMSSAPNPGGGQTFPAKYVFDVATVPSCASDFVAMGIPALPTPGGQANIVGFNYLYTNPSGTGYCGGTGPTVMFAYASGTGMVPASVTLSANGQQIAYVENLAGSSYLHVLTIGTTGSNGLSATSSVVPGGAGGNNAIDQKILLSPDGGLTTQSSTSAAYVDYSDCTAYVTTYSASIGSGYLFKIANVFNTGSAPTIVWSIPINAIPSGPVYDAASTKIFFTDSNGRIDYVTTTSGSPQVFYGPIVAPGSTSENPVILDGSGQMVYATFNSNGTNAVVVQAPTTLASWVTTPVGAASTTNTGPYAPDFNKAWYTGAGTPLLYVAGTGTGTLPTLYSIGFNASGVMNSSANGQTTPLATGTADSSPVTEFYNATLAKDFLFVGVTNNCVATAHGGAAGCVLALDITSGFPTANAATTALAAAGGTTGIVVDNDSSLTESSSIYYATKAGGTLVKATQNGLQ